MLFGNRDRIQELESKIQENDRELAKLRIEKSDALSEIETLKQEVAALTQTIAEYKEQEETYIKRIDNEIRLKHEAIEESTKCKKQCDEITVEYSSLKSFYRQKIQEADEQQEKLAKRLACDEAAARNALSLEIENDRKTAKEELNSRIMHFSDNYYRCFTQIQELLRAMNNSAAEICSTYFLNDEDFDNAVSAKFQNMYGILSSVDLETAPVPQEVPDRIVSEPTSQETQPLVEGEVFTSLSEPFVPPIVDVSEQGINSTSTTLDESFAFPSPASLSDRFRSAIAESKNASTNQTD